MAIRNGRPSLGPTAWRRFGCCAIRLSSGLYPSVSGRFTRCVRPNGGAFARGRAGYLTATGTLRKEQHMAQVVRDVMTSDPVSLAPDASATEAGRLMRDQDT